VPWVPAIGGGSRNVKAVSAVPVVPGERRPERPVLGGKRSSLREVESSSPNESPESSQTPLKICRHCAVATRTTAAECPACGKPYERQLWRWWFAIPIVIAAFFIGYGGRLLISGDGSDDDAGTITLEQGRDVLLGISASELDELLDGEPPAATEERPGGVLGADGAPAGPGDATCLYYALGGETDSAWEFCFQGDTLVSSEELSG
jgi:RNA polymerase subunit RPABC4/transcription elongation factor Spt4